MVRTQNTQNVLILDSVLPLCNLSFLCLRKYFTDRGFYHQITYLPTHLNIRVASWRYTVYVLKKFLKFKSNLLSSVKELGNTFTVD